MANPLTRFSSTMGCSFSRCHTQCGFPRTGRLHSLIHAASAPAAKETTVSSSGNSRSLPHIIETKNVPVYLYAQPEEVEPEAIKQLIKLAESPLPVGYVSVMPDCHLGKGATIGTVFASSDYVCPNAVGVDIGCGMCAVPIEGLHKDELALAQLLKIQELIKRRIPTASPISKSISTFPIYELGGLSPESYVDLIYYILDISFNKHNTPLPTARQTLDEISHEHPPTQYLLNFLPRSTAAEQLGTLGGGNHFLEVVYDEEGQVWAMLHSGSRNVGNQAASHHDKVAQEKGFADPGGLNHMRIDSREGQAYLQDMQWSQRYAHHNRRYMMELLVDCIENVVHKTPDMGQIINRHHNYCTCQRCSYKDPKTGSLVEKDLWVTRKGATSAAEGEYGIIPGSMGVGSYIVKGKGNPMSWNSCSHGAGRKMSRTKAKASILQEDFVMSMEGIVCDTNELVRDEAPAAYKDLTTVMANQADLVDVAFRLRPLINVKGYEKGWGKKHKRKP